MYTYDVIRERWEGRRTTGNSPTPVETFERVEYAAPLVIGAKVHVPKEGEQEYLGKVRDIDYFGNSDRNCIAHVLEDDEEGW